MTGRLVILKAEGFSDRLAMAISTVLGVGLIPFWPGTFGSAAALVVVFGTGYLDIAERAAFYVISFAICVWAAHMFGRRVNDPDSNAIVCDETWGMALVWEFTPHQPLWMIAAFVAFRVLDAWKPLGISAIDRNMRNGLGVMVDDGYAAFLAIVLIKISGAALT